MVTVPGKYIHDIRKQFPNITEADVSRLYEKAYKEIYRRIVELSEIEHIDCASILQASHMMNEINDSILNLTLSYIQFEQDHQTYSGQYQHIFDFVEQEQLPDTFFEQSVTEGHPFHPMTKTKLGFSVNDVIQYSPEFRNLVKVIPILCDYSLVQNIHSENDIHKPHLEQINKQAKAYCESHDLQFESYELLFIHEWQFEHFMYPQFKSLFDQQRLIPLHHLAVESHPLLSFRTLDVDAFDCIIKTAVNVQATSAVRNVSPASINNGIRLSHFVEDIYRNKSYNNSYIQKDLSGSYLNIDNAHANKCSYMLRARIPQSEDSHQLVCGSLITTSFISQQPILIECIEIIMSKEGLSFEEAATQFLTAYAEQLLSSTYRLMLEEGISLEGHMQNSTVIIKDGMPEAFYMRDFGGVRLFDTDVDIDTSTGLLTEDFADLLSVFSHAVLYNHLFQLIRVLDQHGFDADKGYEIVRHVIASYHEQITPEINILEQPTFRIKSLLKMRIQAEGYDYQYSEIKNPLYKEVHTYELD
ncbi:IucA/IucC family protein [Mammaliicoccus sp. Dog046]|uniref:IucA/IucC family protein n=1 Tax=Mammaliicoccus sp. Dog046 TaxID=3034233 RepID=UPI002B25A1FD|nr:IucA/IucC family protein [Mammaliicoccus sp. Dog046]WQK85634.1 IucA/IucC family protein [Mammaliicoccus sp. Dog046]